MSFVPGAEDRVGELEDRLTLTREQTIEIASHIRKWDVGMIIISRLTEKLADFGINSLWSARGTTS